MKQIKIPEYLLSTPRLIAVTLTLVVSYLAITKVIEPSDFLQIVTLVFGYFFGSRGKEEAKGKTNSEEATDDFYSDKLTANDPSNQ